MATVAANIVLSEGEHVDSFLHARNAHVAQMAMAVIAENCFHHTVPAAGGVASTLENVRCEGRGGGEWGNRGNDGIICGIWYCVVCWV